MMKRKLNLFRGRQRRLALEGLEGRAMLAGNVTATLSGGNLIIRGDNADNGVYVAQVAANQFVVVGFEWDGSATKVNNSFDPAGPFTVTGNIDIDVKKGDDAVGVGNDPQALIDLAENCFGLDLSDIEVEATPLEGTLQVPRDLIVNLGDGGDAAAIIASARNGILNGGNQFDLIGVGGDFENPSVFTSLSINTGNGGGVGCVSNTDVAGLLNFVGGSGTDYYDGGYGSVSAGSAQFLTGAGNDGVFAFGFDVDGSVVINTGAGGDSVQMDDVRTQGAVSINMGAGGSSVGLSNFDIGGDLTIAAAAGADSVFLSGSEGSSNIDGALSIQTGDQADSVQMNNVEIGLGVVVGTGNGDDEVHLRNFSAQSVSIDTGNGNDGTPGEESPITVEDASITFGLAISLGSGNDLALVEHVLAQIVTIDGGNGNDEVEFYNSTTTLDLIVTTGNGSDFIDIVGGMQQLSQIGRDLVVNTGAGNDELDIHDTLVGRNAELALGAGDDEAFINGLHIGGDATLNAGAGHDNVQIEASSVDGLFQAFMGAGNDFLSILGSTAGKAKLFGGENRNDFDRLDTDFDNQPNVEVFEFEDVNFVL